MLAAVTATCAGWSTLALNIADFSRYAVDRKVLHYTVTCRTPV